MKYLKFLILMIRCVYNDIENKKEIGVKIMEEIKKSITINKEDYKVQDGKVFIESDELAKALSNEYLDLDSEEEQAVTINIYKCS